MYVVGGGQVEEPVGRECECLETTMGHRDVPGGQGCSDDTRPRGMPLFLKGDAGGWGNQDGEISIFPTPRQVDSAGTA